MAFRHTLNKTLPFIWLGHLPDCIFHSVLATIFQSYCSSFCSLYVHLASAMFGFIHKGQKTPNKDGLPILVITHSNKRDSEVVQGWYGSSIIIRLLGFLYLIALLSSTHGLNYMVQDVSSGSSHPINNPASIFPTFKDICVVFPLTQTLWHGHITFQEETASIVTFHCWVEFHSTNIPQSV